MPKLTQPKELVLQMNGYDIPVRVLHEGRVEYDRATVLNWFTDPDEWACDEDDVLAAVALSAPGADFFLSSLQVRDLCRALLDDASYQHAKEWFCDTVAPAAKRLAKKAPDGSRIVRLNGLLVRPHREYPWLYSLTDAHKAARPYFKSDASHLAKSARNWRHETSTMRELLHEMENAGNSQHLTERGRKGGTWACKELLYAYTEWLHPKLHLQILQVFADYEEGKLVKRPKVTSNGIVQDEQWQEHREASVSAFHAFNAVNKRYGLSTPQLTNCIYEGLHGTGKKGVAKKFNVPRDPLRDHLPIDELEKHTTCMALVRQGIAKDKVTAEDSQQAYIYARAAGNFVHEAFEKFNTMTPEEIRQRGLKPRKVD